MQPDKPTDQTPEESMPESAVPAASGGQGAPTQTELPLADPLKQSSQQEQAMAVTAPEQAATSTQEPLTQPGAAGQPPIQPPKPAGSKKKRLIVAGIALFIILLISIIALVSLQNATKKQVTNVITPTPKATVKTQTKPTSTQRKESHTMVYGAWTGQTSVIRAVDTTTSAISTVATLPLTVRKVSVLPDRTLLYIDQINTLELGSRISVYNPKTKTITLSIPAESGYKVQDYLLSPNKQFITIWEVSFAKGANTLLGGQSRVYAVNLINHTVKNLLYEEITFDKIQKTPLATHYPSAILNNGTVFADKRVPGDLKAGIEWAYGMSVVDFDGENKRDIATMVDGTYGTQPVLSPDGKYLAFAGYTGKTEKNGPRQAVLKPNSVDLLNTQTLQRFRLPNLPPSETYPSVAWDKQTGNIIISLVSPTNGKTDVYTYNLGSQQAIKLTMPTTVARDTGYITQLTNTKTLIGTQSKNQSHIGNLGQTSTFAYTQAATLEADGNISYLSLQDPLAQYIEVLPGNYFGDAPRK